MITRAKENGFSLIEMVSVIILLGIVSVFVLSRFDISPFQTASFEQEMRSALRFAQKFSIASGCDVQVSVVAASDSYALSLRNDAVATAAACLTASGPFGTALPNPSGNGAFTGTAPTGVDVTTDLTFFYDRKGTPSVAGATINIDAVTITVENITGFVY